MIGITLSPDQIQRAPPEVRRWLEQQITGLIGIKHPDAMLHPPTRHPVSCSLEEAQSILLLIHGLPSVVAVFFELGREPVAASVTGLRALRLDAMGRHAHGQTQQQVVACLRAIDEALQQMTGNPEAVLTVLDAAGHCIVADATASSILALWQGIVAAHQLVQSEVAATPVAASQIVPPALQAAAVAPAHTMVLPDQVAAA